MANRNNVHIVQRDTGWGTLREGGQRATQVFGTQAQAIQAGPQMARQGQGELLIHGLELHGPMAPLTDVIRDALMHRYDKAAWMTLGGCLPVAIKICDRAQHVGDADRLGSPCSRVCMLTVHRHAPWGRQSPLASQVRRQEVDPKLKMLRTACDDRRWTALSGRLRSMRSTDLGASASLQGTTLAASLWLEPGVADKQEPVHAATLSLDRVVVSGRHRH